MDHRGEEVESGVSDRIERDPMAGGRASHAGHAGHAGHGAAAGEEGGVTPRCLRCGYALVGLDVGGRCPECGEAVWNSNRVLPTSGMSIASMVCGIVGLVGCVLYGLPTLLLGPLAVIFGEIGARQLKRGECGGNTYGFAMAGRICGLIGTVLVYGTLAVVIVGVFVL